MKVSSALVATAVALMSGCAHRPTSTNHTQSCNGSFCVYDASYDGFAVSGLFLIEAGQPIVVRGNLPSYVSFSIQRVEDCTSGEYLPYVLPAVADQDESEMQLPSGFVYGRRLELMFFGTSGPPCVRVDVAGEYSRDGKTASWSRDTVRLVLTKK
jgi:hypothetical protein